MLVGQMTGGNQRGINGGAFFFVTLSNSQLEVDLPLVGNFIGDSSAHWRGHPVSLSARCGDRSRRARNAQHRRRRFVGGFRTAHSQGMAQKRQVVKRR